MNALLIEDNPGDALLLDASFRSAFQTQGSLTAVDTVDAGRQALREQSFGILLSDLNLPDSDAAETIEFINDTSRSLPIVVITGIESDEMVRYALESGAQDYLVKGQITKDLLRRTVRHAIERHKLVDRLHRLNQELSDAMGKIRTLEGLLPICAYCKKIRDEEAEPDPAGEHQWVHLETYISDHSEAELSHGICPECMERVRAEAAEAKRRRKSGA